MKPTTTELRRDERNRFLLTQERAAIAAGLREDLTDEERAAALRIGRVDYQSAGAKRTAVHIPSEREAFEARWPLLAQHLL